MASGIDGTFWAGLFAFGGAVLGFLRYMLGYFFRRQAQAAKLKKDQDDGMVRNLRIMIEHHKNAIEGHSLKLSDFTVRITSVEGELRELLKAGSENAHKTDRLIAAIKAYIKSSENKFAFNEDKLVELAKDVYLLKTGKGWKNGSGETE